MAGKKKQIQEHLHSQEEFDGFLKREGLKVIDAYTAWCGPCKAVQPLFKQLKIDLADDILHFATAETDSIESLSEYTGTSKPTFLIYGGDVLVNAHRGANGPKISQMVEEELQKEHEVLDGEGERVPFDPSTLVASRPSSSRPRSAKSDADAGAATPASRRGSAAKPKTYTLALIKPDAVSSGHADAIFTKIAEANIKVVQQDEITLTEEQAQSFYAEHKEKEFFPKLVEFMTSGPIQPLVLSSHGDVVQEWRDLLGPTNAETAKEEAPESIRALYGTDNTANAAHGSDSKLSAYREIEFFFPEWALENLEADRVVLLVTPDAVEKKDDVLEATKESGFTLVAEQEVTLTEEQCVNCFEDLTDEVKEHLTSGPSVVLSLKRVRGFDLFPALVGVGEDLSTLREENPDCLRAKFGEDNIKMGVWHPQGEKENDKVAALLLDEPDELEVVDPHLQGEHPEKQEEGEGEQEEEGEKKEGEDGAGGDKEEEGEAKEGEKKEEGGESEAAAEAGADEGDATQSPEEAGKKEDPAEAAGAEEKTEGGPEASATQDGEEKKGDAGEENKDDAGEENKDDAGEERKGDAGEENKDDAGEEGKASTEDKKDEAGEGEHQHEEGKDKSNEEDTGKSQEGKEEKKEEEKAGAAADENDDKGAQEQGGDKANAATSETESAKEVSGVTNAESTTDGNGTPAESSA